MLSERLSEIAAYCRVEADDAELPGFVNAAAAYLAGAGVREPQDGSPRYAQYLQCVKYLALDLYDRRDTAVDGALGDNPAFRRLINQLKLTEPVPESGTGEGGGRRRVMHVDAGKLSKRIQFLRKTTAKDADGYDVPGEPELVRETWAQFSQTSGTELIRANAEFGEAKVRFLTRANPELLDRRLLIRYDGRDYNILYVNTYGDEGKYMEFWCERITQEGKV